MIDRRMVTDVGLALLIALPAVLPAAPSPWNSDNEVSKADDSAVEAPANERDWAQSAPMAGQPRYGRS